VRNKLKGRKYLRNLLEKDTYYKKIARWKHALRNGSDDEDFADFVLIDAFGWSWDEINNIPEQKYLAISKILSLKNAEEAKQAKRQKNKKR
jgi:hypothetical protein